MAKIGWVQGVELATEKIKNYSQSKYINVNTDYEYYHKNMLPGNKTATINYENNEYGNTCYFTNKNLMPTNGTNRDSEMPYEGITLRRQKEFYELKGTSTGYITLYLLSKSGSYDISLEELGITGNTVNFYRIIEAGSNLGIYLKWDALNENKEFIIQNQSLAIGHSGVVVRNSEVTFPENTKYIRLYLSLNPNITFDDRFQIVMTEAEVTSTTDETYGLGDIQESYSFPYKTDLQYKITLMDYINNFTGSGNLAHCLFPESYGAVGDGVNDDYEAIITCLEEARLTNSTVMMCGTYNISQPLPLKYSNMTIFINSIIYNGTDRAVIFEGSKNDIIIRNIKSNGVGLYLTAKDSNTLNNTIKLGTINSTGNCIHFETFGKNLYGNKIEFVLLSAGGDGTNCIYLYDSIDYTKGIMTENTFIGGQCSNADWAVYGAGGNSKFMYIQVETNIKGGFVISSNCTIFAPRSAESGRDGEYAFLKFKSFMGEYGLPNNEAIYGVKYYSAHPLSLNDIDLTEAVIEYKRNEATYSITSQSVSTIECNIVPPLAGQGSNEFRGCILGTKSYIWGRHLIFEPFQEVILDIANNLDLRDENITYQFTGFPTEINIKDDINVYLHPTYCFFGYKKLIVNQLDNKKAKIYDWNNNLIFDGETYTNGKYEIVFSRDPNRVDIRYDGTGQLVTINSLTAGGSSEPSNWELIDTVIVEESKQEVNKTFSKNYKRLLAEVQFKPGTQASQVRFTLTNTTTLGTIIVDNAIKALTRDTYLLITGENIVDGKTLVETTNVQEYESSLAMKQSSVALKNYNINGFSMKATTGDNLIPAGSTVKLYGLI